ncbi:unnamed protein product [Arctogadus glacialis]
MHPESIYVSCDQGSALEFQEDRPLAKRSHMGLSPNMWAFCTPLRYLDPFVSLFKTQQVLYTDIYIRTLKNLPWKKFRHG